MNMLITALLLAASAQDTLRVRDPKDGKISE